MFAVKTVIAMLTLEGYNWWVLCSFVCYYTPCLRNQPDFWQIFWVVFRGTWNTDVGDDILSLLKSHQVYSSLLKSPQVSPSLIKSHQVNSSLTMLSSPVSLHNLDKSCLFSKTCMFYDMCVQNNNHIQYACYEDLKLFKYQNRESVCVYTSDILFILDSFVWLDTVKCIQ